MIQNERIYLTKVWKLTKNIKNNNKGITTYSLKNTSTNIYLKGEKAIDYRPREVRIQSQRTEFFSHYQKKCTKESLLKTMDRTSVMVTFRDFNYKFLFLENKILF